MELILVLNCSLLYLDSNNINCFKGLLLKKSFSYKYNFYKNSQDISPAAVFSGCVISMDIYSNNVQAVHKDGLNNLYTLPSFF